MTDPDAALHPIPDPSWHEDDDTDTTRPVGLMTRFDLGATVRQRGVEPKTLAGLIYPGKLHSVSGPPEAGKSTLAIWLAMRCINLGHPVLVVDEEAGPEQTGSLLRSMGADPVLVDKHLHYIPFPGVSWNGSHLDELHQFMGDVKPVLSVWDSNGAMLALANASENDAGEVTRYWNRVLFPVAHKFGCAVLVTDHDAKGGEGARGARGSTAKLAVLDVQLKLAPVHQFSHHEDGLLSLEVTKDRPGWLHRHWQIRVTRDPLTLAFARTSKPPPRPDGRGSGGGMASARQSIEQALTDMPSTIKVIVDRIVANGGVPLRRNTASELLNELAADGRAIRIEPGPGRGREVAWLLPGNTLADATTTEPYVPPPPDDMPEPGSVPAPDWSGAPSEVADPPEDVS